MRVGAHVSASGGLARVPQRAQELGCDCAQIFLSGPTGWRPVTHTDADVGRFKEEALSRQVVPVVAHAIYLINLASPDEGIWSRSIQSLIDYLTWAERLELAGVVAHLGSHRKLGFAAVSARLFAGVEAVLRGAPGDVPLLMEVCAGQGGTIGSRFEELAAVVDALGREQRLGICLDTAHLYAAGYDIASGQGLEATIEALDHHVGIERLSVVHANDSRTLLGSNVDRHANIGEGAIGIDAFERIVNHPVLRNLPFLLEVPGLDHAGPDRENVTRLRSLGDDHPVGPSRADETAPVMIADEATRAAAVKDASTTPARPADDLGRGSAEES